MTAKGHITKMLRFLYGQVDIIVKSDGRAIDQHIGRDDRINNVLSGSG